MELHEKPRVIVGVDGSLAGLRALRVAVREARARGGALHAVRAWPYEPYDGFTGGLWAREVRRAAGEAIVDAFTQTLGGLPPDIPVSGFVIAGRPGDVLVGYADRDDDLLVVGRGRHLLRRSVSGQCARQAGCPVLVVPADEFARTAARDLKRELAELVG